MLLQLFIEKILRLIACIKICNEVKQEFRKVLILAKPFFNKIDKEISLHFVNFLLISNERPSN